MKDRIQGFFKNNRLRTRTAEARPEGYPFGGAVPVKPDAEHQVLLLKVNKLEEKLDLALDIIKELRAARHPRYIGTKEACRILGISRSTLMSRLSKGLYPFAVKDKESGEWRFNEQDLYQSLTV